MKDRGTVLYIGGFELPDKNAAAQRVVANGKLLRDLGYNVVFDGITKSGNVGTDLNTPQVYFGFESYSRKYPTGFIQWNKHIISFKRYKKLINKYKPVEYIIAYNLPAISLYRLFKYCNRRNIHLIADCTEWYLPPQKGNFFKRVVKKMDINLRMKVIQPMLPGVISISEYLFDFYQSKGCQSLLLPPLVDLEDKKWEKIGVERANEAPILFYAGSTSSFSDPKRMKDRIDWVIEALSIVKQNGGNFVFKIVGMSQDEFLRFFPSLVHQIKILDSSVVFYGKQTHDDTIVLLKKSDFFVFLRDNKILNLAGFPTKFVEAISSGIPVLTNKNMNLLSYLKDGYNGFFIDVNSIDSIANSIHTAISIRNTNLERMKNNCANSKMFDYKLYINEVNNFLQSL